jgi:hypothetical protein
LRLQLPGHLRLLRDGLRRGAHQLQATKHESPATVAGLSCVRRYDSYSRETVKVSQLAASTKP